MQAPALAGEPEWKQLLHLGEQLMSLHDTGAQCRLVEETIGLLLNGGAQVWLSRPWYPLPGDPETELLPEAKAPLLVKQAFDQKTWLCTHNEADPPQPLQPGLTIHFAAVPIIANTNLLGIVHLERPQATPLTAAEMDLLDALTAHVATAMEFSRQSRLKNWRHNQLALVRSVSAQVANLLDLDTLCSRVTELIQQTFQLYYVAIFTRTSGSEMLSLRASAYQKNSAPPIHPILVHLGEGIVGSVAQTGESIYAPDVTREPRFRYIDVLPETVSELTLPLKVENEILGVLDVQSDQANGFHENDILVLDALADSVALAVQTAHLYTDLKIRAGQIASVVEISHALTSILDLDTLFDQIVLLIQRNFKYTHIHIFSVHPGRRLVIYQAGTGERSRAMHDQQIAYPLDAPHGLIPWVARSGQSYLANDVNHDPLYRPSELPPYNTGAELTVPLKTGDEVIGVLDIQSTETNAFNDSEVSLFEAIAGSIAISYRNAGLYSSEKWRRQVADSFRDVAYQISTNSSLDLLLDTILSRLESNLPCDAAAIWLLDRGASVNAPAEKHMLRLAAAHGVDPSLLEYTRKEAPDTFEAFEKILTAETPFIRTASDPLGPLGYAQGYDKEYSSIAAPMRAGNQALGILTLAHHTSGRYGSEAQSMTATFASYAAVAIQNARLYTEAQEQAWVATMLVQVAEASQSTNSIDDLLATMLRLTRLLVGVKKCAFMLHEENAPTFDLKAWYGFEPPEGTVVSVPVTAPALVRLKSVKQVSFLPNPAESLGLNEVDLTDEASTLVMLPLLVRSEVIGVFLVTLQSESVGSPNSIDPKALSILQGISHQTAVTVENLRLLEARQEDAYVTAALLQVAQAVVSASELDEVLENIVNLLPILVGIDACLIYQWDEATLTFRPSNAYAGNRRAEKYLLETPYPLGENHLLDCVFRSAKVQLSPIPDASLSIEEWSDLKCVAVEEFDAAQTPYHPSWLIGFPLSVQGKVIGVMLVRENKISPASWERRMEIIYGIAQQTSLALQNDLLKKEMVQNERIEREMQLTRQIQETFLPDHLPTLTGWGLDLRWEPARQVGGDFYDVFTLDGNRLGLVVADVSDKGLPAAMVMTVTRTLIRANIYDHPNPADVLSEVNRLLFNDSPESMFITAVYAVLSLDTGELIYANAGHNRPLIFRTGTGKVEQLPKGGTALGVLPELKLENMSVPIARGDTLVLFTDGATDTLNPDGEDFGEDRLREIIHECGQRPVSTLLEKLDQALKDHRQNTPPADDITLLAIQRDS